MRVVVTARLADKHREALKGAFPDVPFDFVPSLSAAPAPSDTEVIVTYGDDLGADRLAAFSRLRWVMVLKSGIDGLPRETLLDRGIVVTNARGIHAIPMAEHVIGLLLAHVRRLYAFYEEQKARRWSPALRVEELAGKTVLIVGAGAVGRAIAERLVPFGVRLLGIRRSAGALWPFERIGDLSALEDFLPEADIVVVVLPLTSATAGLFDRRRFSAMKPGAVFVNVGRGALVDEGALWEALQKERLSAAYLDVFADEPLPPEHPFWAFPRVILTPHVAGRTPHYLERALELFRRNLLRYRSGDLSGLENRVDLRRGY